MGDTNKKWKILMYIFAFYVAKIKGIYEYNEKLNNKEWVLSLDNW